MMSGVFKVSVKMAAGHGIIAGSGEPEPRAVIPTPCVTTALIAPVEEETHTHKKKTRHTTQPGNYHPWEKNV